MRPLTVAMAAAALFVGTADAASHAVKDPLRGNWESTPYSVTRLRGLLLGLGYSPNEITKYIDKSGRNSPTLKEFKWYLTFYRSNGRRYVTVAGHDAAINNWTVTYDPRRYTLLPNRRVVFSWEKQRWIFKYRVTGNALSLHAVTSTDSSKPKAQVRLDRMLLYEIAATPYTKQPAP